MPDDEISKSLNILSFLGVEAPDPKWIKCEGLSAFNRIERRERNLADEVRSYIFDHKWLLFDLKLPLRATSDHKTG